MEESREAKTQEIVNSLGRTESKDLFAVLVQMAFELVSGSMALAELIGYRRAEMKGNAA